MTEYADYGCVAYPQPLTKNEQVKNILAFLSILFGDDHVIWWAVIMEFKPDYLIEKFNRYIEFKGIASPWGLHPTLRASTFNRYLDKYGIEHDEV